jgi:catechol 2,3-dioxygenase-like lactoylglutathione lyase family enzyme
VERNGYFKEDGENTIAMEFNKIKETCIYVHDLEAAKSFYHGKLGLPVLSFVAGKHVFFRAGASVLLCFNPDDSRMKVSPPPHACEGRYHFAFEVRREDYEARKAEIVRRGIRITDKLIWKTGQESFYFEDPAGNVLEVVPEGIWE